MHKGSEVSKAWPFTSTLRFHSYRASKQMLEHPENVDELVYTEIFPHTGSETLQLDSETYYFLVILSTIVSILNLSQEECQNIFQKQFVVSIGRVEQYCCMTCQRHLLAVSGKQEPEYL